MLYLILRYLLRYRLKVVKKNVAYSFPEKTEKERNKIVNDFYRHFTRQNLESLQFIFISKKAIQRKFIFDNIDILDQYAQQGRNITAVIGHYGNWDWIASIPLWSDKFIVGTLYKRIKNKFLNNLFLKIRSRFGVYCIDMKHAIRGLVKLNNGPKPNIVAYIADQCPWNENTKFWINFLNQPTATQSGWATIARKFDTPVVYLNITPIKKGHYLAHIEIVTEDPSSMSERELVEAYFSKLERDIKQQPEYWLWSHRRWKR